MTRPSYGWDLAGDESACQSAMKTSYRKWAEKKTGSQLRLVALKAMVERELREFVMSAGMRALGAVLEEERTELCGPRCEHRSDRSARRCGHAPGELVFGGRRVSVKRPRARNVSGEELSLPSWRQFSVEDPLHERALTQMLVGCRRESTSGPWSRSTLRRRREARERAL